MDVMNKHKHEPGFTIIEVSLVLAIAGLVVGNLSDTRPFNNYV
jgi:prepilin-type N-terminal cleavage/methylation domain-containing protein